MLLGGCHGGSSAANPLCPGQGLEKGLPPLWSSIKSHRPDRRIQEVLDEIYDLFIDLDAGEDQLELSGPLYQCPDGIALTDPDQDRATTWSLFLKPS